MSEPLYYLMAVLVPVILIWGAIKFNSLALTLIALTTVFMLW